MSDEQTLTPAPAEKPVVEKIDPGFVEQFRDKIRFGVERDFTKLEGLIGRQTMAALSNFQPATRAILPKGIGYLQGGFIGTQILPEIVASPDGIEQASYPTYGKESLYSGGSDIVGISGDVARADLGVTWTSVTLDVHGKKAYIDPREQRAAAASGLNIYEKKADLIRGQVEAAKEKAIATLMIATGSYASSSFYTACSSTTAWGNTSSTPIAAVVTADEVVRAATGAYTNVMWLSPLAFRYLRFHSTVLALIAYSGQTKNNPAAPASLETLAALFNKNILLGTAINITTPAGTLADVWSNAAGITFVNNGELFSPSFGFTLTSAGYPKVMQYRDDNQGAEGSEVVKYVDAYKPVVTMSSGGFLWTNAGATT